ncbi:2,4-dienoyl-CoA reductase [(3E)-enoyl-CoA-producing], mitochondrial-like isoform X2 [Artemia franciscana]|nr:hypothetical protein QYM36_017747 [Artemia franciscana]
MVSNSNKPQAKYFPANTAPMLPEKSFSGKVAFITGGGTGLGKAMATVLSKLGAKVAIGSRKLPVLEETAKEISIVTGNEVFPVQVDIRDPVAVKSAVDMCVSKFGLPNIVINNAAGNFISPTERLSANAWKTVIDIVLNGTAFVTMEIGKRMIKEETGGVFLCITTPYTTHGSGFVCPSASAKAGVEAMTKSLSSEWGRYGIRMNCIAPGPIETEGAFSRLDPSGKFKDELYKTLPVGRMGEPEELANLASYMVSDYASWLSGEVINFDGGKLPFMAGDFNALVQVKQSEWDMLEQMIRSSNQKSKSKL